MAQANVQVVEKGDIYFFIRPDVGKTEVKGPQDIQRFYMVLNPDQDSKFREIVVGQKRMPDIGENQRFFAFVDHVYGNPNDLQEELSGKEYGTKTRGERQLEPDMLDYEHAEFILIGAKENPEKELGVKFDTENESINQSELVKELKMEKSNKRLKPIAEGKWD